MGSLGLDSIRRVVIQKRDAATNGREAVGPELRPLVIRFAVENFEADLRRNRGEKHAVTKESGGDQQSADVSNPTEKRSVIRSSRSGTSGDLDEFQFGNGRHKLLRISQQLVDPAGRHCW